MPRWYHLCQQCWENEHAGQYLPDEAIDYGLCDGCGDNTLVYGSRTLPEEGLPGFHIERPISVVIDDGQHTEE